jgi:hypothetical protein
MPHSLQSDDQGQVDEAPCGNNGLQDTVATTRSGSSPFQGPDAAAALGGPPLGDSGVVWMMQRIAIDITASLLGLPFSFIMTADILRQVWRPQQAIDPLARSLAFLGCAFLLITWWAHAVIRCRRPWRTAAHRETWWLAVMLWSSLAQQVATHLVRLKPIHDPKTTLNILGVGFGVLMMQPHLISKW